MATIRLEQLAHSYNPISDAASDLALKELNLTWVDGGTYALLGPSGCGKTTLLNIISGLLHPTQGRVFFDDQEITSLPTSARNIAQIFQFPVVYDTMSVEANLTFPLINKGVSRQDAKKRAHEIAEILEISDILRTRAHGLSADLKQIISLGRGLVRDDVNAVLFDEPLTVIDPALKWRLRAKIKDIQAAFGHTMIYVTHDQTEALTFADQVVVMEAGSVRQIGSPEALFLTPEHEFVGHFIGSPGMNILPIEIREGGLYIGDKPVENAPRPPAALSEGLALGIRPEFIHMSESKSGIQAAVTRIENVGKHLIVRTEVSKTPLSFLAPGDSIIGETVFLQFDAEHIHLYSNGKRIRESE